MLSSRDFLGSVAVNLGASLIDFILVMVWGTVKLDVFLSWRKSDYFCAVMITSFWVTSLS